MIFVAGRGWASIVNLDEHESAVGGKPMGCDVGCRERNAAEGLNRVGVELWMQRQFIASRERLPRLYDMPG